MLNYWTITNSAGGLMARFDDSGNLAGWTPWIREASHFLSADAAAAAIKSICRPEFHRAVRTGDATREVDQTTGDVVYLWHGAPMRTPSIPVDAPDRRLDLDDEQPFSPKRMARAAFADAQRQNWKMQTKPRISPARGVAEEYRLPASARARRAGAYGNARA